MFHFYSHFILRKYSFQKRRGKRLLVCHLPTTLFAFNIIFICKVLSPGITLTLTPSPSPSPTRRTTKCSWNSGIRWLYKFRHNLSAHSHFQFRTPILIMVRSILIVILYDLIQCCCSTNSTERPALNEPLSVLKGLLPRQTRLILTSFYAFTTAHFKRKNALKYTF